MDQINATLSRLQCPVSTSTEQLNSSRHAVALELVGNYAAQLQLVRTLRPHPSAGFGIAPEIGAKSTSRPPPYDDSKDSFVVGPLRLELRPLVALLSSQDLEIGALKTRWGVYQNISPVDVRGHFLLVPDLLSNTNCRGQTLTRNDCHDLVTVATNIRPAGSALLCYNSFGAGASQNHFHCHLWPTPPIPLLETCTGVSWDCYAVSKAKVKSAINLASSNVTVAPLSYPVCCIKISENDEDDLVFVLASVVETIQSDLDAPHNVCLLNCPDGVDAYIFVRSKETSPSIAKGSKLGIS